MSETLQSSATQELPSGVDAADAGGGCDVPSDAAAAGTVLSPLDAANLLAGQAVAAATSYLDARSDVAALRRAVAKMMADTLATLVDNNDPDATPLVKLVRLLGMVCYGIVQADEEARTNGAALNMRDIWQDTARDVVRLIRYKSWMLKGGDTPPPDLDRIDAETGLAGAFLKQAKAEQQWLRAELAQLEAAHVYALPQQAFAARQERINAIRRALAGDEPRG